MSRIFLTNIDLNANQLLNVGLHASSTPPSSPSPVEGQIYYNTSDDKIYSYDGASWNSVGTTTEEIQDAINTALVAGTGISKTYDDGAGTITIANTGVTSIASQDPTEIYVSGSAGAITIGLPDDVTIDGSLVVGGNLTVSGSVTTLNTDTLTVEDNIIILNSNVTGSPVLDAGIEVERGTSTNASLIWDEDSDTWKAGLTGSEVAISLAGHTHSTSDVTGLQEYVEDTVGTMATDSSTIDFTYSDNGGSAGTLTAAVITASTSYLSTTSGLGVDIASVEAQLVTDGFTKKATANVGNGSATSFVINHGLSTRDVTVQVFRNSSPYDQVEADVLHYAADDTGNTSKITIAFAAAPSTNQFRVVVVG